MAGYACTLCNGDEPAVMLITPLTGGDTMPVGEGCAITALIGLLSAHVDVDPERLYENMRRFTEAEHKRATLVADPKSGAEPNGRRKVAKAPRAATSAPAGDAP
jgi:hypothetical protein